MDLSTQKRMAADLLDCGENRVRIDPTRQEDVGDAITKADVRRLIQEGAIEKVKKEGKSRGRIRRKNKQKGKGRRSGHGSREGKAGAREKEKREWMSKVRAQRKVLKGLKDKLEEGAYRDLYKRIKGGQFDSKKQLKDWINQKSLLKEGEMID